MNKNSTVGWYIDNMMYATKNMLYALRDYIKMILLVRKYNKQTMPKYAKAYAQYGKFI